MGAMAGLRERALLNTFQELAVATTNTAYLPSRPIPSSQRSSAHADGLQVIKRKAHGPPGSILKPRELDLMTSTMANVPCSGHDPFLAEG